jgi:pimeloyl-ACP methyl ester carboxylesterase
MFDERAFIARVESADVKELAQIVLRPTGDEERALRVHLGDDRYDRLHTLALKRSSVRGTTGTKGNVVVIHGIMGAELSAFNRKGAGEQVWAKVLRLVGGWLERLRLSEDGRSEFDDQFDVRATGIMKRYYGELMLSLALDWNVRAFWFDWRKDLNLAAGSLSEQIRNWFPDSAPVHIVAHSMGGLVARTFIKNDPKRWEAMVDKQTNLKTGGRLIMLGTPNHGSFAATQVITGLEGLVRKLALIDLRHSLTELRAILNTFVGTYQMLPSPLAMGSMEPLYRAQTYGDELKVSQHHLDNALKHHEALSKIVYPDRMIYVAGYDQPTFSNIKDFSNLGSLDAYEVSMNGDGRVPHALGFLETAAGEKVPNYFINEAHGDLTKNGVVFDALSQLLETGETTILARQLPSTRAVRSGPSAKAAIVLSQAADEAQLQAVIPALRVRSAKLNYLTNDERRVEEILTRGFLGLKEGAMTDAEGAPKARVDGKGKDTKTKVEIRLILGSIEKIEEVTKDLPVDAISVGHYLGVKPQYAEKAIDEEISRALPANKGINELSEADLIITQYTERGTIRGELGQFFFLADPRPSKASADRVIAIAGMGVPGRFGEPELTVLARELCWALGMMGKRHLATLLIGTGQGNLAIRQAVSGWMRGINKALSGAVDTENKHLRRITFVEKAPGRIEDIQKAIVEEKNRLEADPKAGIRIDYEPLADEELAAFRGMYYKEQLQRLRKQLKDKDVAQPESKGEVATRITVELDGNTYSYGAITENASIPVREIPLDPSLVMDANQKLAGEKDPDLQRDRGLFLQKLLLPNDLRERLHGNAPVVMILDATTARIHWEMLAMSESGGSSADAEATAEFLGLGRGFTRQLRTTFAPPPEPPPPPRRVLRVLIVADPAEDAPLVGAQQEGMEVADLLEHFNETYADQTNKIEVVRMIGPQKANRTDVLQELMNQAYDALHFAGHCVFEEQDPAASGWIFTDGQRLTAKELDRIDRVPKFVFSNACESGVTPDRSDKRSVYLAPGFAESFFKRGVSNFVCTAWPVEDGPAREFALRLYAGLVGLRKPPTGADSVEDGTGKVHYERGSFESMHEAMRAAREKISGEGGLTWGAYQHYGNPHFRFFDTVTMERDKKRQEKKASARTSARKGRKNKPAAKKRGAR